MANYTLSYSLGSIVVLEGTKNTTSTSLALPGEGSGSWGADIDQNFVSILENFAGPVPPSNPIPGQLWYSTADADLKLYDGSTWNSLAGTVFTGPVDRIHDADSTTYVDTDDAAETIVFFTSSAERMRILPTGEIGVGTTTPTAALDIHRSGGTLLRAVDDGTSTAQFDITSPAPNVLDLTWNTASIADLGISASAASPNAATVAIFRTTSTTAAANFDVLKGDGSAFVSARLAGKTDPSWVGAAGSPFGVGEEASTAPPSAPLHVVSATVPQVKLGTRTAATDVSLAIEDSGGTTRWSLVLDNATNDLVLKDSTGFPALRVRASDDSVQVSGTWYLPNTGGNSGDVLTSDGVGGSSWVALPFTKYHDSGNIAQTGAGTYSTLHGFASQPRMVMVSFVAKTASNGYAAGEEISPVVSNYQSTTLNGVMVTSWTTTEARVTWLGNVYVPSKSGGSTFVVTEHADWDVRIQVWG